MPFDFNDHDARITELLSVPTGDEDATGAFITSCKDAGHRAHFFVPSGKALRKRGQTLYRAVEDAGLLPPRGKAGKDQWQAFCEGNPLSLSAILKIDSALNAFRDHGDDNVRHSTHVMRNGQATSFTLAPGSIVPSVFYVAPGELQQYRTSNSHLKRDTLSVQISAMANTTR